MSWLSKTFKKVTGSIANALPFGIGDSITHKEDTEFTADQNDAQRAFNAAEALKQREFNSAEALKQREWAHSEAIDQRNWEAAQAASARAWQESIAKQAHQFEVADMRAAGLNPILSATGGNGATLPVASLPGSGLPSGASASGVAATSSSNGAPGAIGTGSANAQLFSVLSNSALKNRELDIKEKEVNQNIKESLSRITFNDANTKKVLEEAKTFKEKVDVLKSEVSKNKAYEELTKREKEAIDQRIEIEFFKASSQAALNAALSREAEARRNHHYEDVKRIQAEVSRHRSDIAEANNKADFYESKFGKAWSTAEVLVQPIRAMLPSLRIHTGGN